MGNLSFDTRYRFFLIHITTSSYNEAIIANALNYNEQKKSISKLIEMPTSFLRSFIY